MPMHVPLHTHKGEISPQSASREIAYVTGILELFSRQLWLPIACIVRSLPTFATCPFYTNVAGYGCSSVVGSWSNTYAGGPVCPQFGQGPGCGCGEGQFFTQWLTLPQLKQVSTQVEFFCAHHLLWRRFRVLSIKGSSFFLSLFLCSSPSI